MKTTIIFALSFIFSPFIQAGNWDVQKFYDMQKTARQGKYGSEQVFMVYFRGVIDGQRLEDSITKQPRYCFPKNKMPSDENIFLIVKEHIESVKPHMPEEKFYGTPLVVMMNEALFKNFDCSNHKKAKNKEIQV